MIFEAFTFAKSEPSTAGIWAEAFNCKILLALVPTSTESVPVEVIGPPIIPVPPVIFVTDPAVAETGSHSESLLFQPRTCPEVGGVAEMARDCRYVAFKFVRLQIG